MATLHPLADKPHRQHHASADRKTVSGITERPWTGRALRALARSVAALFESWTPDRLAVIGSAKRKPIRVGFLLDIVGYGLRDASAQESLQQRLYGVVRLVLDDLHIALRNDDLQCTGDGILVILPEWVDVQSVVAGLLRSVTERLARDNTVFKDQMRLRMAAEIGPVCNAKLGFEGAMVTNMARLLNSEPLRGWVAEHPERELSVAVSDSLHRFVVVEGTPELSRDQFTQIQVQLNGTLSAAWLWTR
jgi:hypothetical protein